MHCTSPFPLNFGEWLVGHALLLYRICNCSSEASSLLLEPPSTALVNGNRPVCIITGATSGLGGAAAYALSREGFYVVLAGRSSRLLSKKMMDIKGRNRDAQLKAFEVDNESVAGKCYSTPKQYPYYVYEYSKLCLLLFSYELHRQLGLMDKSRQVSVNAVDPGAVKTNIMRELPSSLSFVSFMVLKLLGLLHSPENAVNSILDAALATPEVSGIYFFGGKGRSIKSSSLSYDTKLAKKLWETSSDLFQDCILLPEILVLHDLC